MGPLHDDVVKLVGIDSNTPPTDDDTLLSPALQPGVLASPEAQLRRMEIEAALFGTPTEALSLGRFRLLQRLGEGGMGIVYAAFDDRLDRKIAVKLLRQSRLDNEELRERTLREARALARLSHPNVVHVYEVGEIEDQLFVAMEFLAGPTLRAWLDEATRSWQEVLAVFRQAGEGLVAAHAEGIVHRDFKPHNVMFGADGRVRVLDFGLARVGSVQGQSGPAQERGADELTQTGAVLGTPAYMAPEQFEGRTADARTDQFAFCVTLYEALYGERPFTGRTLNQLADAVKHGKIDESPSGSSVPAWLRKVVLRGLERAPDKRFESMPALLDALGNDPALRRRKLWTAAGFVAVLGVGAWGVLSSEQAEAQMCTGMEDKLTGVWDDSRRAEVETAIASTKLNYAADTWTRVEARLDTYAQAWVAARIEACEATHRGEQSGELLDLRMACLDERLLHLRSTVDMLAKADASVVKKAVQAVTGLPSLERCADADALTAEIPLPENPEVATRVAELEERMAKARAMERAGQYEAALEIVDVVVTEAGELGYEPLQARAWLTQGDLQRQAGKFEAAEATLMQAYDAAVGLRMAAEAASSSSILVFVVGVNLGRYEDGRRWATDAKPSSRAAGTQDAHTQYLSNMGGVASKEGKYEEARGYFQQALTISEEVLGPEHLNNATYFNNLGDVANVEGKYEEAREHFNRARTIWENALGPEHPYVAYSLHNLGDVAAREGKYEEARGYLERALAIKENALGPEHPDVSLVLSDLGDAAWNEGKYEDARQYGERALAITEKTLGHEHISLAGALSLLGKLARTQGKYEEARRYQERALAIAEKTLGPEHPNVAVVLTSLGILAEEEGKWDAARGHHERVLAIAEKTLGPEHPMAGVALINLGNVAWSQENYEEARGYFERALTILEKTVGPNHPYVAASLIGLGQVLLKQGHPDDALPELERALTIRGLNEIDPTELAQARFALACALWDASADKGRDRARAIALAEVARAAYAEAGENSAKELEEVEAWQHEHAG